jgi:hypothetical protein
MYVCSSYISATNCLSVCLSACPDSVFVEQIKEWNCEKNLVVFFLLQREFFLVLGVCTTLKLLLLLLLIIIRILIDLRMLHSCNFSR